MLCVCFSVAKTTHVMLLVFREPMCTTLGSMHWTLALCTMFMTNTVHYSLQRQPMWCFWFFENPCAPRFDALNVCTLHHVLDQDCALQPAKTTHVMLLVFWEPMCTTLGSKRWTFALCTMFMTKTVHSCDAFGFSRTHVHHARFNALNICTLHHVYDQDSALLQPAKTTHLNVISFSDRIIPSHFPIVFS